MKIHHKVKCESLAKNLRTNKKDNTSEANIHFFMSSSFRNGLVHGIHQSKARNCCCRSHQSHNKVLKENNRSAVAIVVVVAACWMSRAP